MTITLQAVIFDLDGVITDTAEYHYVAWKNIGNELGIDIDRPFNEQLKGVSRTESLNRLLAFGGREDLSEKERNFYAEKKNDQYKQLITQITPADTLPGITEVLEELRSENMKIGLASASRNAFFVIDRLQLDDYFDVMVDVEKVANGKPDPEIFLTAAAKLGVDPRTCVGIEDAEAGVEAIKRADMTAIGIGSATDLALADLVLPSTDELTLDVIRRVFGR